MNLHPSNLRNRPWRAHAPLLAILVPLVSSGAMIARQEATSAKASSVGAALDDTRVTMGKWIETQQIISKERKEWQQGKEILVGRVELIRQEVGGLEQKIAQAEASVVESNKKKDELIAQNDELKSADLQLSEAVIAMEGEVRQLFKALPEPIQTKIQPLFQRMPEPGASTRASTAERFQNVLGILNEINKANSELSVGYEVRELASGRLAEVRVVYVGLAQAYFVSANGEAGIGHPTPDGWEWKSSNAVAGDVLTALEILQGKHTPAFVPLPVKIQ